MSSVIGEYLNRGGDSRLNRQEFGALEDCRELSDSNVEFLQSIDGVLEAAEGVDEELVERIESILSAIVTNGQTCIDGLVESRSSLGNALTAPLLSAGKLYSVSLGLVKNSLSRRWKKRKQKGDGEGGNFPAAAQSREPLNTLIKVRFDMAPLLFGFCLSVRSVTRTITFALFNASKNWAKISFCLDVAL